MIRPKVFLLSMTDPDRSLDDPELRALVAAGWTCVGSWPVVGDDDKSGGPNTVRMMLLLWPPATTAPPAPVLYEPWVRNFPILIGALMLATVAMAAVDSCGDQLAHRRDEAHFDLLEQRCSRPSVLLGEPGAFGDHAPGGQGAVLVAPDGRVIGRAGAGGAAGTGSGARSGAGGNVIVEPGSAGVGEGATQGEEP